MPPFFAGATFLAGFAAGAGFLPPFFAGTRLATFLAAFAAGADFLLLFAAGVPFLAAFFTGLELFFFVAIPISSLTSASCNCVNLRDLTTAHPKRRRLFAEFFRMEGAGLQTRVGDARDLPRIAKPGMQDLRLA